MVPGEVFELLRGVRAVFVGLPLDWRPPTRDSGEESIHQFLLGVRHYQQKLGAKLLIAPRPGNGNRVMADHEELIYPIYPGEFNFLRTNGGVDGIVTTNRNCALAYFVADCHLGIIFDPDPDHPWLALLHLGMANLLHDETVIAKAVELSGRSVSKLHLAFGFGIGPCCYGLPSGHPRLSGLHRLYSIAVDSGEKRKVEQGPRVGQVAIDLAAAIMQVGLGMKFREIEPHFEIKCSAHLGRQNGSAGAFHSNVYQQPDGGKARNLFMICLAH